MKKIITASLVAMMAVTAANAEIASTKFVTDRTGDVANSNYVKTLDDKTLTGAVDDLDARLGGLTDTTGGEIDGIKNSVGDVKQLQTDAETVVGAINEVVTEKADKATTLSGYGITDAYTKTQVDTKVSTATTDMATKTYVGTEDKKITDSLGVVSAANMGTTATTVVGAIKEVVTEKQDKSTAMSIGAANGAWTDLTKATGYSTTGTHSLVLKNGVIQWEEVKY